MVEKFEDTWGANPMRKSRILQGFEEPKVIWRSLRYAKKRIPFEKSMRLMELSLDFKNWWLPTFNFKGGITG